MLARIVNGLKRRALEARARAGARRVTQARLARGNVRRVLVVCYGNIYRSPFVAARLRELLAGVEVRSGGFHEKTGRASPQRHLAMSAGLGVALDRHRSTRVGTPDLDWADTIVLMDARNWRDLRAAGAPQSKYLWLGALLPGGVEIPDPYPLDDAGARGVLERMLACCDALAAALRN